MIFIAQRDKTVPVLKDDGRGDLHYITQTLITDGARFFVTTVYWPSKDPDVVPVETKEEELADRHAAMEWAVNVAHVDPDRVKRLIPS